MKERLIHIHSFSGVTWQLIKNFLQFDPTLKDIYSLTRNEFRHYFKMKASHCDSFYNTLHYTSPSAIIRNYQSEGIHVFTTFDKNYPQYLKQIYDPPWLLYCKGNLSLLEIEKKISIVGTRYPSQNGLLSTEKITIPLVKAGWCIVSGLALGIDAKAHLTALNNNGYTIAVLGSGFNHIYPRCHQLMATEITSSSLLVSEYPPNTRPQKWHFPMRNRIISGLSKGTIIVEAKAKSGSLITADLALEQGREVFAVPGSIFDERTEGTHWLIQQGAKLTKCGEDVLNEL